MTYATERFLTIAGNKVAQALLDTSKTNGESICQNERDGHPHLRCARRPRHPCAPGLHTMHPSVPPGICSGKSYGESGYCE